MRKLVISLSTGLTALLWLTWWILETYFAYTYPRTPQPASGRMFPINVHGTIVYLTHTEYLLAGPPMFYAAFYSFLLLGLLLAFLGNPFSHKD